MLGGAKDGTDGNKARTGCNEQRFCLLKRIVRLFFFFFFFLRLEIQEGKTKKKGFYKVFDRFKCRTEARDYRKLCMRHATTGGWLAARPTSYRKKVEGVGHEEGELCDWATVQQGFFTPTSLDGGIGGIVLFYHSRTVNSTINSTMVLWFRLFFGRDYLRGVSVVLFKRPRRVLYDSRRSPSFDGWLPVWSHNNE